MARGCKRSERRAPAAPGLRLPVGLLVVDSSTAAALLGSQGPQQPASDHSGVRRGDSLRDAGCWGGDAAPDDGQGGEWGPGAHWIGDVGAGSVERGLVVTRTEYIAQLQALGHFRAAAIKQANGRYRVECECGYKSTTRINLEQAVETIEHHRRKVLAEYRANGRVLPGNVAAGL